MDSLNFTFDITNQTINTLILFLIKYYWLPFSILVVVVSLFKGLGKTKEEFKEIMFSILVKIPATMSGLILIICFLDAYSDSTVYLTYLIPSIICAIYISNEFDKHLKKRGG